MKKTFLLLAITAFVAASCTKSEVAPGTTVAANHVNANFSNNLKATPVSTPAPAAKGGAGGSGGGGNGGGGTAPAPVTNLSVYLKWLPGTWVSVVWIPGTESSITLQIIYKSNSTFTLLATNPITGERTTAAGTWVLTVPPNLPLAESGFLSLSTNAGTPLMSGLFYFARPGVTQFQTPVNNLVSSVARTGYTFQKL